VTLRKELGANLKMSAVMALASLTGKGMAIFKTIVIAAIFGASGGLDAFWVAFVIPNIFPMFVRSAFVTSFVPFFMRQSQDHDDTQLWQAANVLFTVALIGSALVSWLLYWQPQWLVSLMAPGLSNEVARTAATLLQTTVFSLFFVVGISMLTAISHCKQRFFATSLESLTTNAAVIVGIYFFASHESDVNILAIGTVLGFAIQFLIMLYSCRSELIQHIRPSLKISLPLFREYLSGVSPVLIGAISGIAMGIISQVFLSYFDKGSVSVFQYASMIALLPIEILASSIQATFFPTIAKHSKENHDAVIEAHVLAARILVFTLAPISAVLMALDQHIVRVFFGYGKFSDIAIQNTSIILSCLAIGIVGRALTYFNFQTLHAMGQPWAQVRIGFIQLAMNVSFSFIFMKIFGLMGIALASSLSLIISTFISYRLLSKITNKQIIKKIMPSTIKSILISALTFIIIHGLAAKIDPYTLTTTRWGYALVISIFSGIGFIFYFGIASIAKMKETEFVKSKIINFKKRK
jgi:putative peptidoglycan lipid II flippase